MNYAVIIAWAVWYLVGLSGWIVCWLHRYGEMDLLEFVVGVIILGHGGLIVWMYFGLTGININRREIIIFRRRK